MGRSLNDMCVRLYGARNVITCGLEEGGSHYQAGALANAISRCPESGMPWGYPRVLGSAFHVGCPSGIPLRVDTPEGISYRKTQDCT